MDGRSLTAKNGGDVLAERSGAARLRSDRVARLPGDVRHALYFHPDWPADEHRQRYQLHAGRPTH